MTLSCVYINTTYYLELFITDINGNPKIGLNPTYTIYKSIDNTIVITGTLTDIGNGLYQDSYIFTSAGSYYIIYTTPSGYTDETESIIVQSEIAKEDTLLRVLGLTQHNFRIKDQQYDDNGDMTFARVRLYNNATDTNNDTNCFAEYEVSATYVNRLLTSYKSIKIL